MQAKFKGIIFDVSGVLEYQGMACPGAVELVNRLRRKGIIIRVLSNSTLASRNDCATKLNRMGFNVLEQEVITASFATAEYLKRINPGSCWVMLCGEGLKEFRDFNQDQVNPEYIVMGDYREGFNFQNMNRALKLLLEGCHLIVMIPEKVDHSMGEVELTVGAYGKMLEDAAGITAVYIGKPHESIFDMSLISMGLGRSEVLMVGDRMETDILGAKRSNLSSVLIKAGEFRERHLQLGIEPDYIVESIQEIEEFF